MAAVRITVEYEGAEHTLAFARNSEAISVERAICIACGVPWGSVTRLVDATGAVYSADPTLFPDGKKLALEVVAIPRELLRRCRRTHRAPWRRRVQVVLATSASAAVRAKPFVAETVAGCVWFASS